VVGGHVTAEAGNQPSSAQTASSASSAEQNNTLYDIIIYHVKNCSIPTILTPVNLINLTVLCKRVALVAFRFSRPSKTAGAGYLDHLTSQEPESGGWRVGDEGFAWSIKHLKRPVELTTVFPKPLICKSQGIFDVL
jgi:hypothetical protein